MNRHEWHLKRNCSLTPRQLLLSWLVLCGISFAVGVLFLLQGSWMVLAFSSLEMAVAAAFWFIYARHAGDHEHVALLEDCLLFERVEAGRVRRLRLDRRLARIVLPGHFAALIRLEAGGSTVEVGRFVTPARRRQVTEELRASLQALPTAPAPAPAAEQAAATRWPADRAVPSYST